MNFLSSNIRFLRADNRLTQGDLAKIVGKTRSLVSAWELDERSMTTEDIVKLSNHFDIPMDILVGTDLRTYKKNNHEFTLFLNKYNNLSKEDKELINSIIDARTKQADKQLVD